jgi:hypothetical protein
MGKISSGKTYGKIYYEKDETELHQLIQEKLGNISHAVARHIITCWRPTAEVDVYDPNISPLSMHDLITVLEFLERYETEEWAEIYLLKFQQYINELKNTGGWTQMFQEWADDPRKDDSRVTSRRVENGNLMFKDKKDYDEWFQEQKQKDLLADALREGDGSSRNQINILPRKKRNGVNHA